MFAYTFTQKKQQYKLNTKFKKLNIRQLVSSFATNKKI